MRRGCTAWELALALNEAIASGAVWDSDVLVRNSVGNLAIERDGSYVGFVDLLSGEVEMWDASDVD